MFEKGFRQGSAVKSILNANPPMVVNWSLTALKVAIEIGLARRVSISLCKQKVENLPVVFLDDCSKNKS